MRIGVLQPDPFLPVTEATARALKLTETALQELGYEVVPFEFSPEDWSAQRDLLFGMLANGAAGAQADDLLAECETVLPPLKKNIMILNANPIKRCLIDFALKFIMNKRRVAVNLSGLRKKSTIDFERFLKQRTEWIHKFA